MSHRLFEVSILHWHSIDVVIAVSLTLMSGAITLSPFANVAFLAALVGLPFLLFLPGYLFVVALFPEAGKPSPGSLHEVYMSLDEAEDPDTSPKLVIGPIEVITLSVVSSLSIAMLAGFVHNYTPWAISLKSVVVTICGIAVFTGIIATYRRTFLSPHRQPIQSKLRLPFIAPNQNRTRRSVLVNGFATIGILFGTGTVVYGVIAPRRGETYTEFYVLTGEDGDFVADDYPRSFTVGESKPIVVGIDNNEGSKNRYEVVIELHRIGEQNDSDERNNEPESTPLPVLDREELYRYATTISHDDRNRRRINLEPTLIGEELRLGFFLYRDSVPEDPSPETAYRSVHLWIDVAADDTES